ncbi:hypothetical protein [Gorillibacterium massiliense]|uniref:hypothetical protein n=1 Tax=Gorillibacterium massiliense TaxID=1280390 RepID=UPI0004B58501|nr:hypothetical protein [Gorillibacterium massiliense]
MGIDRFNPDTVLLKRQATLYNLREQVVGDLIILSQRTVFQPKKYQSASTNIEILHEDIAQITPYSSFFLIPDGLKITLQSTQEFRLKLYDRKTVIDMYRTLGKGHLIPPHEK